MRSHEKQAEHHDREAARFEAEEYRQADIQQQLPIIRELQMRADSLRSNYEAIVLEARAYFQSLVDALKRRHNVWAAKVDIQEAPAGCRAAFTVRSHEGFEREAQKRF